MKKNLMAILIIIVLAILAAVWFWVMIRDTGSTAPDDLGNNFEIREASQ